MKFIFSAFDTYGDLENYFKNNSLMLNLVNNGTVTTKTINEDDRRLVEYDLVSMYEELFFSGADMTKSYIYVDLDDIEPFQHFEYTTVGPNVIKWNKSLVVPVPEKLCRIWPRGQVLYVTENSKEAILMLNKDY